MADSQKYGRTANLFDDEIESGFYNNNGELVPDTTTSHSTTYIPVDGTTYTISGLWTSATAATNFAVYEWDNNKNWLRRSNRQVPASSTLTFSIGSDTAFFTLQIMTEHENIMLNTGSTALPYQPYLDWQHSLRKFTTATEAVENPLYSDGTAITSYTIKGNTVQNGTPTRTNPVDVNGVGVRTENLLDIEAATDSAYINSLGEITYNDAWSVSDYISVESLTTYTISRITDQASTAACHAFYDANKSLISTIQAEVSTQTFETPTNAKYIRCSWRSATIQQVMLNTGSTAKPYEPYGYKIPILSGSVTTNIYLGSTQTMRRIKKLVLTGEENFGRQNISNTDPSFARFSKIFQFGSVTSTSTILYASTHFTGLKSFGTTSSTAENCFEMRFASNTTTMMIVTNVATTATSFNQWLSDQYANGTPVTVWYILATAETDAVNEPLMKIGDYADTLSNATAIPTTEGANSITVDTTVQPSEFTATWTGWHNANVKEWDGSDWQ